MSDVVVSVTESTTTVAVTENAVNVAVTETPVVVSTATAGLQGASGAQGIGYTNVTSTTSRTIGSGLKTFTLDGSYAGAFVTGMRARAIHTDTPGYFVEGVATYVGGGTFIITVDKYNGSGSHNAWVFAVAGEIGQTGATGSTGATGATGAAGTGVPTGGTAGQVLAKIDATDYNTQWVNAASGTPNYALTAGTAAYATASGSATVAGTAVTAGTAYFATTAGTATYATTAGTAVSISGSITNSQVSDFAAGTVTRGTANSLLTGDNSFVGQNTFTPTNSSSTALRVVGQASQGAILQDWRSSSASLASMGADGALTLPNASITAAGNATFNTTSITPSTSNANALNITPNGTGNQITGTNFIVTSTGTTRLTNLTDTGAVGAFFTMNSTNIQVSTRTATNKGLQLVGVASQSADLMQFQTSANAVLGGRNAVGQIYTGSTSPQGSTLFAAGAMTSAAYVSATSATFTIPLTTAQIFAIGQTITVTGVTGGNYNQVVTVTAIGGSAGAWTFTATGTGFTNVAGTGGNYAISPSGTGTTATITLNAAPNIAVGDLISVNGFTGVTAYNTGQGVYAVVTGVSNTSPFSVSYASTATGTATGGAVAVPSQASITPRSAGTRGLTIQAASGQTANLTSWLNSSGTTLASVGSSGLLNASSGLSTPNVQGTDGLTAINLAGSRSIQIGSGTNQLGGGAGVIGITNATTVPTSNPTAGGILYVENGALKYRGSSGTITILGVA